MKTTLSFFFAIFFLLFARLVYADNSVSCQNQISMQLQEEGWVSSHSAEVTVSIQAASSKNNVSAQIEGITNRLSHLITPSASWRLVNLSTQKNNAGLFTISAQMSTRLDNDQLSQLQANIDSLNKAGEQYKIDGVDYQPTLAEFALEHTRLRGLIYKDILEQQKNINDVFSNESYSLQSLTFDPPYTNSPKPMLMFASVGNTRQAAASENLPFSQEVMITANIVFASSHCEKKE